MKINEVSKKYSIPVDTLRYWEKKGVIPKINRDRSGYRDYTEDDIHWITFAKCMRDGGANVEYLVQYLLLFQQGNETVSMRKDLLKKQLEKIQKRLHDTQTTYEFLKKKIDHYDDFFN